MGSSTSSKKKPYMKALLFGVVSIALYVSLLGNQDFLNGTFSKGGFYAFLPIITAFVFSFFHGSFTGHFWTVMGVEAAKKIKEVK
jgi:F0F1-type ATP synthase assembly protein I